MAPEAGKRGQVGKDGEPLALGCGIVRKDQAEIPNYALRGIRPGGCRWCCNAGLTGAGRGLSGSRYCDGEKCEGGASDQAIHHLLLTWTNRRLVQ